MKQLDVTIDSGLLEIHTESDNLYGRGTHAYWVEPNVVPLRIARGILGDRFDGISIFSDAALERIEWSDGRHELVRFHWGEPARLEFRVVGLFTDGSEAVLYESADHEEPPNGLVALAMLVLLALFGRTISRACP